MERLGKASEALALAWQVVTSEVGAVTLKAGQVKALKLKPV